MKTKWEGLWYNGHGVYSGKTIKKSDIPTYARLIIRHNKYWNEENNHPRFVYCFASGDEFKVLTLESEDYHNIIDELENKIKDLEEQIDKMYTYDQVQYAINCAAEDGARGYGWGDNIVTDYLY